MKRRDFFKSIAGVVAVLGLPKILSGTDIIPLKTEIIPQNKGSEKTDFYNKVCLFSNNELICKGSNVKSEYNTQTNHIKHEFNDIIEYIPSNSETRLKIKGDIEFINIEKIGTCFNELITYRFYDDNGIVYNEGIGHFNVYDFTFEDELSIELSVYKYEYYPPTNKDSKF
jgi:hypothetical protein